MNVASGSGWAEPNMPAGGAAASRQQQQGAWGWLQQHVEQQPAEGGSMDSGCTDAQMRVSLLGQRWPLLPGFDDPSEDGGGVVGLWLAAAGPRQHLQQQR